MSTLFLVRHGQASFGAADYDVLSARGSEQARRLGAFLGRAPERLDAVITGPRRRHKETTQSFLEGYAAGGHDGPRSSELPGLDEYPAEALIRAALPRLLDEDPDVRRLIGEPSDGGVPVLADPGRFELLFERVMRRWVSGIVDADGAETFHDFATRVRASLRRIMDEAGRGARVCVVTSAGPVSVGVQMAVGTSDLETLRLSWVVANASVTELRWRDDELSLVSFNGLPHLDVHAHPELVTYR